MRASLQLAARRRPGRRSWLGRVVRRAGADADPHRPRGRGDHPGRSRHRSADHRPGRRDRGAHRVQEADPRRQGRRRRTPSRATSSAVQRTSPSATWSWWRLPGTVLPGDFTIATRKTYGRTSDGMICSTAELNLGTDHSGILVLPPGTAEPGDPAADVLGLDDVVFHLAITPDRGYCLSVRGMAREIACAYDLDYVDPADVAAAARRGRGAAGDHPARHRRAAIRSAAGHRHRPDRGVAVVDAAAAAAQRHPRDLARRRRHELRDARARPPDARPRPQPDHRRLQGALRGAGGDGRHARRHRAQARPRATCSSSTTSRPRRSAASWVQAPPRCATPPPT